jgi:hypothetical protein
MTTTSDTDGRTPVDPARPWDPASAGTPDAAPAPSLPAPSGEAWLDDDHPTVVLTAYGELPAYSPDNVLPSGPVGGRRREARDARTHPPRRTTPTRLGRIVLPLSLALVSGVALVAAWTHLEDSRATQTPTAVVSHRASTPAPAVPSTAPSVAASAAPSVAPSASATPAAAAPVVDRSVPVVVLNSTRRTGLAAKVAARLRADGWRVVSIGNYRGGGITATTVFAQGHAAAVTTMRGDLPTRDAVARPVGAMSTARLTVVVGPDYPRG